MRGKGNGGNEQGKALTGAERHQRATQRLSDARQQLAGIEQQLADGAAQTAAAKTMEQSAQRAVEQAEKRADQAAAAVVDAHSELLIADGTPEEVEAKSRHAAAIEANQEARQQLDDARATLAEVRERAQAEKAALDGAGDELKAQRREANRLVQSLERATQSAHEQAGREAVATLRTRHTALESAQEQAQAVMAAADAALAHFYEDAQQQLAEWPSLYAQAIDLQAPVADAGLIVYRAALAFIEALHAHGSKVPNEWMRQVGPEQRLAFREDDLRAYLRYSDAKSTEATYRRHVALLSEALEWANEREERRQAQRAAAAHAGSSESQSEGADDSAVSAA